MGQTPEGAKKAAETAKALHGPDHHKKIGAIGGKRSAKKGFAALSKEEIRKYGQKGGKAKKGYRRTESV